MHHRRPLPILALLAILGVWMTPPVAHAGRALEPGDWYRFKAVSELAMAPDGGAVAYIVTSYDKASDESRGALWLATWNGKESLQLQANRVKTELSLTNNCIARSASSPTY